MEIQPPCSAKLAFKLVLIGLAYSASPEFLQAQSSDSWLERPMQGSAQVPFAQMVHSKPAKAAVESTSTASVDSPIYLAQNQERAMPGGAEIPFSQLGPDETIPGSADNALQGSDSFNYFEGGPSTVFREPAFEEYQAGAGEDRPGAFKNTKYRWYGFVRLDGIYDTKPIASTDSFVTSSIPIPQGDENNVVLTPRYSRLGWDTSTDLAWTDYDINTRIEVDFFNGNTSGVFGSYDWRMRFAWIEFGPFLVGQAASVFMDYDVFPNVLDYQGPPGMILMRQGLARFKFPVFSEDTTIAMGVEQPYSDIQWEENGQFIVNPGTGILTDPGNDRNVQQMPDFTGNVRHAYDYGHVQAAGIVRLISFSEAPNGDEYNETGYGGNLTGTWHPWAWWTGCSPKNTKCPTPCQKSRFLGGYAAGKGINRYFQDPNGLGLDGVFTPATGFELIDSQGWFLAYEQWWADRWASNFSFSEMHVDNPAVLPDDTYQDGTYVTANLIWLPFERLGLGTEVLYGERQNKDGQSGEAFRIQTAVQYRF